MMKFFLKRFIVAIFLGFIITTLQAQEKNNEVSGGEILQSLTWATYLGGSGYDVGFGLALDGQGNTYVVGETSSSNIINKNPYQAVYGGGSSDGFISKYSPAGELLWSSFYGGAGLDVANAVGIDDNGNIYIIGRTNSSSGFAQNGHQNSLAGGLDAFMVKFNSEGQRLWGTYYGGTGDEIVYDMDLDGEGNIYMAGETGSASGIAYNGFLNTISGSVSGFLVKFNPNGERIWGTYYNGATYCRSVNVDNQNNVYLAGMTATVSGMAFNGHQNSSGGNFDGYLVKFNPTGQRLWATYYGGSSWDAIRDITTDPNGNVFISGETYSRNGIALNGFENSFQSIRDDWADAFIVKFNPQGVRQWGTYFGGPDHDGGFGVDTDQAGNLFLLTSMRSASGIAFKAFQSTYGGGNNDLVIAKFNPQGNLFWATYYGNSGDDGPMKGLLDGSGNIYLAGRTSSTSGFTFNGYQDNYLGGSFDGFLVKIAELSQPDSDGDGVSDGNDCAPNDNTKYRTGNLFIDADNDGYDAGQENVCYGATVPTGYKTTTLGPDCDDANNAITGSRTWYKDSDDDGYSDGTTLVQCYQPEDYKPANILIALSGDCNETNGSIHPGAPEICDGIDNNCDGIGDEGADVTWFKDADNDGYSDGTTLVQCFKPANYKLAADLTATTGDCNDANGSIYPGATEICDGLDNNCDGVSDEGCTVLPTWYRDSDKDTFGDARYPIVSATKPAGYVANNLDCKDWDNSFYPGAPELEDGMDNDCDGEADEGLTCRTLWYLDGDGDNYGRTTTTRWSCVKPDNYSLVGGDCNDQSAAIYPGAPELPDGKDNDCDGVVDDGLACLKPWYLDGDGDGYGRNTTTTIRMSCTRPNSSYVEIGGDCKDYDATVYPGKGCAPLVGPEITGSTAIQPKAMVEISPEIRVFPNPAHDEMVVTINGFEAGKKLEMQMIQADGKVVMAQNSIPSVPGQQVRFDVRKLTSGYYLLQVRQGNILQTKKVIIAR